jgi:paraquat-inducible protein B
MGIRRLASFVWLILLSAIVICGALFVQAHMRLGPDIRISFNVAAGLEPGKTSVRYRDVEIGRLKDLHLSPDRSRIFADVQLEASAKSFMACDTRYWVVRPRIGTTGVSGLTTAISGTYVAADIGRASGRCKEFTGLEAPPPVAKDEKGKRFLLHAESLGSLTVGSPVYFHRVQAGQVLDYSLSKDGTEVVVDVFVKTPYDQYVTPGSIWWHASGIDLRFGSDGLQLDTQSVASLLSGGAAFDTPRFGPATRRASEGASFALAATRTEAMHKAEDGAAARVRMRFAQSLRGLSIGAPVDFHGVELGRVAAIDIGFDTGTGRVDTVATLDLHPSRLGRRYREALGNGDGAAGKRLLRQLVANGLRGQLRMGSVLTGQRYVTLDFFPRASAVSVDTQQTPVELPTVPSSLEELQDQLSSIVNKLDRVPLDEIRRNLHMTLANTAPLFQQVDAELIPEVRGSLLAAQQSFDAAKAMLTQNSPLQADVREALAELRRTIASVNSLADYLQRHPESVLWGKSADK